MTGLTARDHNRAGVFGCILDSAPLTRGEIIETTGLSKATVSRAVEDLKVAGLVQDGPVEGAPGPGRPSTAVDLAPGSGHIVGASLGLRTSRVLVADLRGREQARDSFSTPSFTAAEEVIEWLAARINSAREPALGPLRQVAVALPARVRDDGSVSKPSRPIQMLAGADLQRLLGRQLSAPILLESDAGMALIGAVVEDRLGAGTEAVLFSVSTVLNFAAFDGFGLTTGRGSAYGDVGLIKVGRGDLTLNDVLSTRGLAQTAASHGVTLTGDEDGWPDTVAGRPELFDLVAEAVAAAVTAVTVILDFAIVYFSGRLVALVELVRPEVEKRLRGRLGEMPRIATTGRREIGRTMMHGAAHLARRQAHKELLDAVLKSRGDDAVIMWG